jgi:glycosyltransferase involved in cell wall biosynthesis
MTKLSVSVIILTFNEEIHIRRCIKNAFRIAKDVFVVDCYSTDKTVEIAKESGATVIQHQYINQAQQFQWALENCPINTEWTLRMDADEYLTDKLIEEIKRKSMSLPGNVSGVNFSLRVKFMDHYIRFGTLHPIRILRMWRTGRAYMEQRWMDERMVLKDGDVISFKHRFIDDNLKGLTFWTQKHNIYSSREILVELDKRYSLFDRGNDNSLKGRNRMKVFYYSFPKFLRAFFYFFIRYIFFLGFLDGIPGFIWLTLQAYWYRFLVDAKLLEMEKKLGKNPSKEKILSYVQKDLGIKVL